MFWYFNADDHPSKLQIKHRYTAIEITPALKAERRRRRKRYANKKKPLPSDGGLFPKMG
jgi:hypothetical protein